MSRLDKHIDAVRSRMTLGIWLRALAWALTGFCIVVVAAILLDRILQWRLPRQAIWFWSGLGATTLGSLLFAIRRRPSRQAAAVAIDRKLMLKEKCSTALFARLHDDPFSKAAVADAEQSAQTLNLQNKFPVRLPKAAAATVMGAIAVFLVAWLMPTLHLFAKPAPSPAKSQAALAEQTRAREAIRRAIAEIDAAPPSIAKQPDIEMAKQDLLNLRGKGTLDPTQARSTAEKAVESVQNAIKEKIQASKDYAFTKEEMAQFKNIAPGAEETGPMADAQRSLAAGKFDKAVEDLSKAVNHFDQMSKKDQKKVADQTENMAKALQKMANDPKVQQQVRNQLQKMGATHQQQQQMQNLMQQAAAGSKQASQQLQQMAKQLAQQQNQNGKQSAQQQRQAAQQMQNAIQQMQQKMNVQINAQQLAQSAQSLAAAMKQSAQGGQPGQSKQGAPAQSASAKSGQGKPQGQKGNNGQQMANAAKQMQQQLQQMQAVANDAQQVAAGQQNAGGQGGNSPGQGQNGGQNGPGQNPGGQGNGQWGNKNQQQANGNGGGPAIGAGNNRPAPQVAPFQVTDQTDIEQRDDKGKLLASNFVKAGSIKGDAKMQLHEVLPPVDKDATDEVGEQRVARQDQDVVRGYFGDLERDTQQK